MPAGITAGTITPEVDRSEAGSCAKHAAGFARRHAVNLGRPGCQARAAGGDQQIDSPARRVKDFVPIAGLEVIE